MDISYEPYRCREITEKSIPPIGSATAIVFTDNGKIFMIPGGKRSQRDTLYLLRFAVPAIKNGDCKLLITLANEWGGDIFEVTADTAEIYEGYLWSVCKARGWVY